jgi:hypothetical protein
VTVITPNYEIDLILAVRLDVYTTVGLVLGVVVVVVEVVVVLVVVVLLLIVGIYGHAVTCKLN